MDRHRPASRVLVQAALLASVLALPLGVAVACAIASSRISAVQIPPTPAAQIIRVAGEGKQPENRNPREKCKRSPGSHATAPKGCTDGGERLPNDKRSPLDEAPPLTPLVA